MAKCWWGTKEHTGTYFARKLSKVNQNKRHSAAKSWKSMVTKPRILYYSSNKCLIELYYHPIQETEKWESLEVIQEEKQLTAGSNHSVEYRGNMDSNVHKNQGQIEGNFKDLLLPRLFNELFSNLSQDFYHLQLLLPVEFIKQPLHFKQKRI